MDAKTIGLLGCGLWGQNILRDLLALGCRVFVVDPSAEVRARALVAGATAVSAALEQLPVVDGIVVATPATTHAAVIDRVLARCVPIFCEKPFTTDLASAQRLAATDARLFVMHLWRYHPGVEALAALAHSGDLGPVESLRTTRLNWTSPRRDIDCIWTLVPHDLSIALEVFGRLPRPRLALAEWLGTTPVGMLGVCEDLAGGRFVFDVSSRYADKRREVRLHCREGVAVLPSAEADCIEITRNGDPPCTERLAISRESSLRLELKAFLQYLDGGPSPRTSAPEAAAIVDTLVQLRRMANIDVVQGESAS